ncbi:MAG: NAD(P)H-binding protein, partial [Acidimicrobiia bacterium]
MPVMVVGADTAQGRVITQRLLDPEREVRVFVTDSDAAEEWRRSGAKVALGDVSDDSHVAAACLNCFSVVLVGHAARDERTRSFAHTEEAVLEGWARAVSTAGVRRVIWVLESEPPEVTVGEVAVVDPNTPGIDDRVFRLDEAARL